MSERVYYPENVDKQLTPIKTPHNLDPSSSNDTTQTPGYEALISPIEVGSTADSFKPNNSYEDYLKMHKVLVGKRGAEQLEEIHKNLANETRPRYLSVAGWSAVEAAIAQTDAPTRHRLALLDSGLGCWKKAISYQEQLNDSNIDYLIEYDLPLRTALDIAILPLLRDMMFGKVRRETSDNVFRDCLKIAQYNAARLNHMKAVGNIEGLGFHVGLGYECNALLAFNRQRSPTWFVMPTLARADTGMHHRKQTHDLLVVHQKWGEVLDLAPIEVKSRASARDRERYEALLVRGKLHMSVPGWYKPDQILQLITDSEEGTINGAGEKIIEGISSNLIGMVRAYYAGDKLGKISTKGTVTSFRDDSLVEPRKIGVLGLAV